MSISESFVVGDEVGLCVGVKVTLFGKGVGVVMTFVGLDVCCDGEFVDVDGVFVEADGDAVTFVGLSDGVKDSFVGVKVKGVDVGCRVVSTSTGG
jgi:hypothetical protein